ncbi:ComEC/Rec2 family competence protein [Arthrobacter sp. NPDC056691]|uniref:ComEC/Rec2 family competence protein n=1 Tax=Arthrobacter sp. NPDC056691 TaxID=3345913 RepID=UPI00366E6010
MVTGDTGGLSEELETAMKTVGLTHLTAVSGDMVKKGGGSGLGIFWMVCLGSVLPRKSAFLQVAEGFHDTLHGRVAHQNFCRCRSFAWRATWVCGTAALTVLGIPPMSCTVQDR